MIPRDIAIAPNPGSAKLDCRSGRVAGAALRGSIHGGIALIFRQMFEEVSSTYTYLLACEETGQALLIDPVYPDWEKELANVRELGLELAWTIETHIHADHITAARRLREEAGSRVAYPAPSRVPCADLAIEDGVPLQIGTIELHPIYTPGHTDDHFSYRTGDNVFSGDALLIDGCGRTDFQNGDPATLYRSVRERLFALPDDTRIYPGHDYHGRRVSTVAQERARNPRIGDGRTETEFVELMNNLGLPYPKFIDHALPGNRECGVCPSHLPEDMARFCGHISETPQG